MANPRIDQIVKRVTGIVDAIEQEVRKSQKCASEATVVASASLIQNGLKMKQGLITDFSRHLFTTHDTAVIA